MAIISKPFTFSANTTMSSSQMNSNFDTLYNDYNGGISAANLATGAVTTAKIADSNVTTPKLADASVTPSKLATNAITLGYAQATSNQTGITTETDLTGLSVTVTVPDGGRQIKITAMTRLSASATDGVATLRIKEGATTINQSDQQFNVVSVGQSIIAITSFVPTSGSHTYKLSLQRTAGTATLNSNASSTNPAFILVELI